MGLVGRLDLWQTAIIAVAAVTRLIGLQFGLPHPLCRPDETSIGSVATSFYHGDLNPHFFNYPPLFMLAVALCLLAWLGIGRTLGYLKDADAANGLITTTSVHRIARFLSAASGIASVALVFRIAGRLFDRTTALVAAAFLALAFLHVRDSHFGVTDIPATFMALLAFLFIVRFDESFAVRDVAAAALASGLATATKYNVALIAGPALLASLAPRQPRAISQRLGRAFLFLVLMAAAFLAVSPYSLIEWRQFVAALQFESLHLAAGHGRIVARGWHVHMNSTLRYGLGTPMLVAGLAGLLWLLRRTPRVGAIVAVFPVSYYLLLGSGYTVFARYMLPIVPFLCLTAAYTVTEGSRWLAAHIGRPAFAPAIVTAASVVVLMPTAASVIAFDRLIARTDNRLRAATWIEQRFPAGATLAQFGPESSHVFVAAADSARSRLFVNVDFNRNGPRPDVIVVPSSPLIPMADVGTVPSILATDYKIGVDLIAESGDPGNAYDTQDEFYLPLAGFYRIDRPGPNLTIHVRR